MCPRKDGRILQIHYALMVKCVPGRVDELERPAGEVERVAIVRLNDAIRPVAERCRHKGARTLRLHTQRVSRR